jgi:hypothetical protein
LILLVFAGFLAVALPRLAGRVFFGGALPAPGFFLLAIDPSCRDPRITPQQIYVAV